MDAAFEERQPNKKLSSLSIEKIKKFHGVFKTAVDGFAISLEEYIKIFGEEKGDSSFIVWSKDLGRPIDALELFTGLLLFSNSRTEDKVKLIFELFDFNEIESLSKADLVYFIECCVSSTLKLHSIEFSELNHTEVMKFIEKNFHGSKRITFPEILLLCSRNKEITDFMGMFKIAEVERKYVAKISQIIEGREEAPYLKKGEKSLAWIPPSKQFLSKTYKEYSVWLSQARSAIQGKLAENRQGEDVEQAEVSCFLKWIYGINKTSNPPIQYSLCKVDDKTAGLEGRRYLYSCGSTVISFNPNSNKQQYYLEHKQEISCLCISSSQQWIASAEHSGPSSNAEIHVWNEFTYSNATVLKSSHRGPIHSLAFTCRDKYLITIGKLQPTALLIFDWKQNKIAVSHALSEIPLYMQPHRSELFDNIIELISKRQILELQIMEGVPQFKEYCVLNRQYADFSETEMTAGLFIHTSETMPRLSIQMKYLGVTGHEDGVLAYWKRGEEPVVLDHYMSPIVSIKQMMSNVVVATKSGLIYIWNMPLSCTNIIDLSKIDIKLINMEIIAIDTIGDFLLVATQGDIVEFWYDLTNQLQCERKQKIACIIGSPKAITVIDAVGSSYSLLGVGGDSNVINIYDTKQFHLVDNWHIGQNITSLHSVNAPDIDCTIVAGTENGYVYVMNYSDMEHYQIPASSAKVTDVKLSPDGRTLVAVTEDSYIHLYKLDKGRFSSAASRKLEAESSITAVPLSITFSSDSKIVLISTTNSGIVACDTSALTLLNFNNEDAKKLTWQQWNGRYKLPGENTNIIPFAFSSKVPITFTADDSSNFYIWKYTDDLSMYVLNNYHVHASPIERACISPNDSSFFTLSSKDRIVCQWSVNFLTAGSTHSFKNIFELYKNGVEGVSDSINREIQYAFNPIACQIPNLCEAEDRTLLVRGSKSQFINDIINSENYDSQLDARLRSPMGSLSLEQIFGFQCGCRRNSLRYFIEKSGVDDSITSPKPESDSPGGEVKKICYFTSKYVVIEDLADSQFIYQGHRAKVTCLAKHPKEPIYASGECSPEQNEVHIWDAKSLEPKVILKTVHENGVSILDFSGDGNLLLTFGSGKQSIQIFNWKQEREFAFRHINNALILDIKFNPSDSKHIVAVGLECIIEMNLSSSSLSIINIIPVISSGSSLKNPFSLTPTPVQVGSVSARMVLLCMDFVEYVKGGTKTVDVLIGSSLGEVGVLSKSKYHILPDISHEGAINVIKTTKLLTKPFCFITAGDDNHIKIWESVLTLLAQINLLTLELYKDPSRAEPPTAEELGGIQSIDLFDSSSKHPFLLVGMRNGDVLESWITLRCEEEHAKTAKNLRVVLETAMVIKDHSSQRLMKEERQISISLHPELAILVSGSYDGTIRIWDIVSNKQLKTQVLEKDLKISALSFGNNGRILAVGFSTGQLMLYKFYDSDWSNPEMEKLLSKKDCNGSVLLIKFSNENEFIAVSYDSEIVKEKGEYSIIGDSSVIIYVSSSSQKSPNFLKSKDPYTKLLQIKCPASYFASEPASSKEVVQNEYKDVHMAFTHMEFSLNSNFLQLSYSKVGVHGKADYSLPSLYLCWDIERNQEITDWRNVKKDFYQQPLLAPTVYARQFNNRLFFVSAEQDQAYYKKEEIIFSALADFGTSQDLICAGSHLGDIHLLQSSALRRSNPTLQSEKISNKQTMEVAKTFNCCCSPIHCIEIYHAEPYNYVFVTSISDEAILKYRVISESRKSDLDYLDPSLDLPDPYSEYPSKAAFQCLISEVWIPRSRICEVQDRLAPPPSPCELSVECVFGRKAMDRRNNAFLDFRNRIVYSVGTMMVLLREADVTRADSKIQQIYPASNSQEEYAFPEISCMCMNSNKHLVALGTAELHAYIHTWDISHDTEISTIPIPGVCSVFCMKFSKSSRFLSCVCLSRDFHQVIVITDLQLHCIIGYSTQFHSSPYKIRDIEFFPNNSRMLVTCGIQHLVFWKMHGGHLEPTRVHLSQPKSEEGTTARKSSPLMFGPGRLCDSKKLAEIFSSGDSEEEYPCCTFMGAAFLDDIILLLIADDGFLYMYETDKECLSKEKAHEDCVTCIEITPRGQICTGGNDGNITLWMVDEERNLLKLGTNSILTMTNTVFSTKTYPTGPGEIPMAILSPSQCIQSLSVNNDRILIGTRNGSLFEMFKKEQESAFKIEGNLCRKIIDGMDDERVVCISFDQSEQRILTLSKRGFFGVWSLDTKLLLYFHHFGFPGKYLHAFKSRDKVLLGFESEVKVLNKAYQEDEKFGFNEGVINAIKISHDESTVVVSKTGEEGHQVELYEVEKIKDYRAIKGYKARILSIDFTYDDRYFLCQDEHNDIYMYDRKLLIKLSGEEDPAALIWQSLGLTIDPDFADFSKFYSEANPICSIQRFHAKGLVVVGDKIGTVRIFRYPLEYTQSYVLAKYEHLNFVAQCWMCPESPYMFTFSETDNAVINWSVHHLFIQ